MPRKYQGGSPGHIAVKMDKLEVMDMDQIRRIRIQHFAHLLAERFVDLQKIVIPLHLDRGMVERALNVVAFLIDGFLEFVVALQHLLIEGLFRNAMHLNALHYLMIRCIGGAQVQFNNPVPSFLEFFLQVQKIGRYPADKGVKGLAGEIDFHSTPPRQQNSVERIASKPLLKRKGQTKILVRFLVNVSFRNSLFWRDATYPNASLHPANKEATL